MPSPDQNRKVNFGVFPSCISTTLSSAPPSSFGFAFWPRLAEGEVSRRPNTASATETLTHQFIRVVIGPPLLSEAWRNSPRQEQLWSAGSGESTQFGTTCSL